MWSSTTVYIKVYGFILECTVCYHEGDLKHTMVKMFNVQAPFLPNLYNNDGVSNVTGLYP